MWIDARKTRTAQLDETSPDVIIGRPTPRRRSAADLARRRARLRRGAGLRAAPMGGTRPARRPARRGRATHDQSGAGAGSGRVPPQVQGDCGSSTCEAMRCTAPAARAPTRRCRMRSLQSNRASRRSRIPLSKGRSALDPRPRSWIRCAEIDRISRLPLRQILGGAKMSSVT